MILNSNPNRTLSNYFQYNNYFILKSYWNLLKIISYKFYMNTFLKCGMNLITKSKDKFTNHSEGLTYNNLIDYFTFKFF